jgi:hypothetical protein
MLTLKRLANVITLMLIFGDQSPRYCLQALDICLLPNLRVLILRVPLVDPVLAFLRRNAPLIRILRLQFLVPCKDSLVIGPFPQLLAYSGSASYLPYVISGSPLRIVVLDLADTTDVDSALEALSRSTTHIETIQLVAKTWDPRVFQLLTTHSPGVRILKYGNDVGEMDQEQV